MLYNTDISPIKQSKIKRCNPEWTGYRYTWGDKSEEPLERVGKNMTKVRNKLNSKSIRSKIKQAHLEELDLSTDPFIMEVLVTTLARHKTGDITCIYTINLMTNLYASTDSLSKYLQQWI